MVQYIYYDNVCRAAPDKASGSDGTNTYCHGLTTALVHFANKNHKVPFFDRFMPLCTLFATLDNLERLH